VLRESVARQGAIAPLGSIRQSLADPPLMAANSGDRFRRRFIGPGVLVSEIAVAYASFRSALFQF